MQGIFLHILADTLGSAGVIVSTLLIRYTGWTGFDPLASIFIAVLIFLSVIPLLKGAFVELLLDVDDGTQYALRSALGDVSVMTGVGAVEGIRFWKCPSQNTGDDDRCRGLLTVVASIDGDIEDVRRRVRNLLLNQVSKLDDVIVQVTRTAGTASPVKQASS